MSSHWSSNQLYIRYHFHCRHYVLFIIIKEYSYSSSILSLVIISHSSSFLSVLSITFSCHSLGLKFPLICLHLWFIWDLGYDKHLISIHPKLLLNTYVYVDLLSTNKLLYSSNYYQNYHNFWLCHDNILRHLKDDLVMNTICLQLCWNIAIEYHD